MKTNLFIILLLVLGPGASSQERKISFGTSLQGGWVHGASDNSWGIQVVNGVRYKTFSVGLGVGIDAYYFRSVPLFVDIRKRLRDKPQTPFVYAGLGTNLPKDKHSAEEWQESWYSGGLYYDVGIGYTWALKGNLHFLFSLGYSQKHMGEERKVIWSSSTKPDVYDYTFRRVVLRLGVSF